MALLPPPLELLPGLWRIALPLPFELSRINVFLVTLPDGLMLVDCGIAGRTSHDALLQGLNQIGVEPQAITKILLTHFHPDHIGLAPVIHRYAAAPVFMHHADIARLRKIAEHGWMHGLLEEAGVPESLQQAIRKGSTNPDFNLVDLPEVTPLQGGEIIDTALGPLEVISTPGHAPGHICLYFRDSKTLLSGDHILPTISPNITWSAESDALGDYLDSLQKIAAYDVTLVVPSHGEPFADMQGRIHQLTQHHIERCEEITAALDAGSVTAHQLVQALWTRKLAPIHHWFALFEVLAHLEFMQRRGRIASTLEGVIRKWRNTP